MRRILPVLIGCVLLAVPGFGAGHGGGGGGHGGGGGARGGGGGGMRGGGGAFRSGGGFRSGGYRGGFRGNYGGFRGRFGYGGYPGFYGYYNPYLWDTGFGWDYGDSGYGYPDSGYGYPDNGGYPSYAAPNPYAASSPQVLIISNQTPPPPMIVQGPPAPAVWEAGPTAQTKKYEDTLFLLAMKDGTIRAVLAYWVEGMTVHYVTMDHEQKQTPLSSLDHSLSERLNRERNVTFRLPG
jgi:hypothetical protein